MVPPASRVHSPYSRGVVQALQARQCKLYCALYKCLIEIAKDLR